MAETLLLLSARAQTAEPVLVDQQVAELSLNPDGRLRVASKPGYFVPISGDLITSGQTIPVPVVDASNLVLHFKNTGSASTTAGAFVFEGSIDSTDGIDGTWFTCQAIRSDSNIIETGRATSSLAAGAAQAYSWELSVNAVRWFRIRCSTTLTAGAIGTWTVIRGTYATEPIPGVQAHAITGTVAVTLQTATTYNLETAASTNAAAVKTSAGNLFEVTAYNPTATPAFWKFYNKASAPTVGTDTPVLTVPIPANGLVQLNFGALGKRFATGIGSAVTAAAVKTDTGVTVAGIQLNATYV